MKRRPNPWLTIPSLLAGALAGVVGYVVTDVSCRVEIEPNVIQSCPGWSVSIAILAFLGVSISMLVVLVLVSRSIAEAREAEARGLEPPGPGCEVPEDQ